MAVDKEKLKQYTYFDAFDSLQLNKNCEWLIENGGQKPFITCMEECDELSKAISKCMRYLDNRPDYSDIPEGKIKSYDEYYHQLYFDLIEEIADVILCIALLRRKYNIPVYDIKRIAEYKMDRLKEQIENGTYGLPPV